MLRLIQQTVRRIPCASQYNVSTNLSSINRFQDLKRMTGTSIRAAHNSSKDTNIESNLPEELYGDDENILEGKQTGDNIRQAYTQRAGDVIRYEYFAQRAELESEIEAASLFRSLHESAKQQSMGFLELMEEYGDADFGATMDNLDVSAELERNNAEKVYKESAVVAAGEDLEQIEEWFEDMIIASEKAAGRLDLVGSMLEAESMEDDALEDDEDEKVKE